MPFRLVNLAAAMLLAIGLLCLPHSAAAQTCSASITDIDFGDPDLLSGSTDDALGTVTVTCTKIPALTVIKVCPSIEDGSGGSAGSSRLLRTASGSLAYQLYSDASRTQGWGSTTNTDLGTVPQMLLGGGFNATATSTLTIYARVFGGQTTAPTGAYISTFGSGETAFGYTAYTLGIGANTNCRGFVGTTILRPAFTVKADARANCTVSANDLNFGTVGVLRGGVRGDGSLSVTCTRGTPFQIALDGGLAGAGPAARRLTSAAGAGVAYGLYRDAGRAQVWGSDGATRTSGTGTGTATVIAVYGEVPAQATPAPGIYSDRIVVTVTY